MTHQHLTNAEFLRFATPQTTLEVELYDRLANIVGTLDRYRCQAAEAAVDLEESEDRVKEMREIGWI